MKLHRVKWEIDIEAETPKEAALRALIIQRDEESIATVFDVSDVLGFSEIGFSNPAVRVDLGAITTKEAEEKVRAL